MVMDGLRRQRVGIVCSTEPFDTLFLTRLEHIGGSGGPPQRIRFLPEPQTLRDWQSRVLDVSQYVGYGISFYYTSIRLFARTLMYGVRIPT